MTVWRIVDRRHLESAFSGYGAEEHGGRFNSVGRRVVYTAGSISLALLEMLAQVNVRSRLSNHVCLPVDISEAEIEVVNLEDLPHGWDARPHGRDSQLFGDRWLDEAKSLVLSVPSVVNPYERNYLINPLHPHFSAVKIGNPLPLPLDPRFSSL